MKITFIGLGIMGSRMAKNLLKNKTDLTVYNRSKQAVYELESLGAKAAQSYTEAVKEADIVFTMLSAPPVLEEVALGENGFLHAMKKNATWIDCSTVNPSFSLKENEAAVKCGVQFMDIPVSGSAPQAGNAELIFLAGGEKSLLDKVTPLLNMMGNKIVHVGETGKGASFKLLVNAMLAQTMLVFSETVLLGEKMGLDKNFLLDTLTNMPVAAPFLKAKAEKIRNNDFEVQFPLEHMQKDLHLASVTAYENKQPLYMAALAKEIYAAALNSEWSRKDFSAIYAQMKNKAQ